MVFYKTCAKCPVLVSVFLLVTWQLGTKYETCMLYAVHVHESCVSAGINPGKVGSRNGTKI
jgi:hypothetical protein